MTANGGKKVRLGPRSALSGTGTDPGDQWVTNRRVGGEDRGIPLKRLTIDIDAGLHRAVKAQCAAEGTTIATVVREFLNHKYGNP